MVEQESREPGFVLWPSGSNLIPGYLLTCIQALVRGLPRTRACSTRLPRPTCLSLLMGSTMPFQIGFRAHSRVSVAPAQRRSGCRGSRLMRGNAHAVHAARERRAAPARRGRAQVTARDGFSDLMALALGGSLTDSRGWAVLVLACGSFLQAASGGRRWAGGSPCLTPSPARPAS